MKRVQWAAVGLLTLGVVVGTFFLRADDPRPPDRPRDAETTSDWPAKVPAESVNQPDPAEPDSSPFRFPTYQIPPHTKPDVTTASKPAVYCPAGTSRYYPLH